jgi:hypothetical protein
MIVQRGSYGGTNFTKSRRITVLEPAKDGILNQGPLYL